MKEKPIKVSFIRKEGNTYLIQFPDLKIPVSVNFDLYQKMRNSTLYDFQDNSKRRVRRFNSA